MKDNIIEIFEFLICLITLPITVPLTWILSIFSKVELTRRVWLELYDDLYSRQQLGLHTPRILQFTQTVCLFKLTLEQMDEIVNIHERYKKYSYCVDLNTFKAYLQALETNKNVILELKETIGWYEIKYYKDTKYDDYIKIALDYYNEWDKEGFDNIIIRYSKELKDMEIQAKKVSLNADFTKEK